MRVLRSPEHHEEIAVFALPMIESYWTRKRRVVTIVPEAPVCEAWRAAWTDAALEQPAWQTDACCREGDAVCRAS